MANTYNSTPVLSKIKIGSQVYYLKDADVRAILDTYGDIVSYDVDTTVSAGSDVIPTSAAVRAYVNDRMGSLASALIFKGVSTTDPSTGTVTINGEVVSDPENGWVVMYEDATLGTTREFVYDGTEWVELGAEGVYLTVAAAEAGYVKRTVTIAGIDLQDNVTADELKAALALKALAYKDSASVTVTDYATGINGVDYTPAGQVAVTLSQTSTAMESTGSYTPAGTVSGNVTAAGAVIIARDDENGVAVSGTISAPTITVTPATASVQHIDSLGTLPSYTAAQYTAPSVTEATSQFASEGIVAALDGDDSEMLVFSAAGKATALTSTGFDAGSYTAAQFNAGALPTLGAAQTVVTGITSATASAPVFTGDKFGATFAGSETAITAAFAGTAGNVTVSGNYDKAGVQTATFTGTEAEIKPTLATGSKTITVQ